MCRDVTGKELGGGTGTTSAGQVGFEFPLAPRLCTAFCTLARARPGPYPVSSVTVCFICLLPLQLLTEGPHTKWQPRITFRRDPQPASPMIPSNDTLSPSCGHNTHAVSVRIGF